MLISSQSALTRRFLFSELCERGGPSVWPYIVQSLDTLTDLAERFGTTPGELMRLNHLSAESLTPGEEILVPFFDPD